ncbi:MAG TPA: MiaB/RimO family radical SAM methylthiotransferase [Armatimonadota bacterium]|nr:MiaB/RimO family radical SAM methylthiotransferase [Armatimonadota bacterium]
MSNAKPAFMILTWGCQMNDDDSLQMANLLEQMGCRQTSEESDADIILLNTCSVRAKPEEKVRSKLGELRLLKQKKRDLVIGVCGCMAQLDSEEFLRRTPFVDLVMGTACIHELPMLIQRIRRSGGRIAALDLPERNGSSVIAHTLRVVGKVGLRMFVPIMYGCNNFCAYCVVPYARGPERSRPPEEIVAEVTELVSHGCKEVTLVGQNVNSYGEGKRPQTADGRLQRVDHPPVDEHPQITRHSSLVPPHDFAGLVERLNAVAGLERIRFTTSHPKDLSDRLIEAIAGLPKVCEHLHLPLQAGDDGILRRMRRGYTAAHYMALVDRLRERVPGISLTADMMVGFPGETEEQFRNTLKVLETIRFDGAFMFAFNPRAGTAAAEMDGQVDGPTKMRRLYELIELQNRITLEKNQAEVGRLFEVLVEGPSEKDPSRMSGRTRTNKTVNFPDGAQLSGQLVAVRAETAHPWGFTGKMEDSRP